MPRLFALAVPLLTAAVLYVFPEQGVPFLVAVLAGMLVVVVECALRSTDNKR
jgi:hypothetical protein